MMGLRDIFQEADAFTCGILMLLSPVWLPIWVIGWLAKCLFSEKEK